MFNPTSPVTGAAVPGFTSPTYTIVQGNAPAANGKQYVVTALGGTQTGVDVNTVSKPFTSTFFVPQQLRVLPQANPVTGIVKNVPYNVYKLITRKGAQPAANQAPAVCRITTSIEVIAGADTYEPEEIKAMLSCHAGMLNQQSSGIADTIITGTM